MAYDKPGGFIGRDALLRQRDLGPPRKRRVQVALNGSANAPYLHHDEPLRRGGEIEGSITSGAYGHRVGASLGMGYVTHHDGVTKDFLQSGNWEVEVACDRFPVQVQLGPWFDPKNTRIRA